VLQYVRKGEALEVDGGGGGGGFLFYVVHTGDDGVANVPMYSNSADTRCACATST
jgi:hypothetical protein